MYRNRGKYGHNRFSGQGKQLPPPAQSWGAPPVAGGSAADPNVMVFTPTNNTAQQGDSQWGWNNTNWEPLPEQQQPAEQQHLDNYNNQPGYSHQPSSYPPAGGMGYPPTSNVGYPPVDNSPASMPPDMSSVGYVPSPVPADGHQSMPSMPAHQSMPPMMGNPPAPAHAPVAVPTPAQVAPPPVNRTKGMPPAHGQAGMVAEPPNLPPTSQTHAQPAASQPPVSYMHGSHPPAPPHSSAPPTSSMPPAPVGGRPRADGQHRGRPRHQPPPPVSSAQQTLQPPGQADVSGLDYPVAASTPLTPAELQFPPVTDAEPSPGPAHAPDAGSYSAPAPASYPNGGGAPDSWGWQQAGWDGYGAQQPAQYAQQGYAAPPVSGHDSQQGYAAAPVSGYDSQQGYAAAPASGYDSQQGYAEQSAAYSQAGSARDQLNNAYNNGEYPGQQSQPAAADWGWGDDAWAESNADVAPAAPADQPAHPAAAEDTGTVGMFFGRGGDDGGQLRERQSRDGEEERAVEREEPAVAAMAEEMQQMYMNGPAPNLPYQADGYTGAAPPEPPVSGGPPPLGHRLSPTGARDDQDLPAHPPPHPPPHSVGGSSRSGSVGSGSAGRRGSGRHESGDGGRARQGSAGPGQHPPVDQRTSPLGTASGGAGPTGSAPPGQHRQQPAGVAPPMPPPGQHREQPAGVAPPMPPPGQQREQPAGVAPPMPPPGQHREQPAGLAPPMPPSGQQREQAAGVAPSMAPPAHHREQPAGVAPPMPPPGQQREQPAGVAPPMPPPGQQREQPAGVAPPGPQSGYRDEPENREVPPPELEQHGNVPEQWPHPQGDGSHAPPPPATSQSASAVSTNNQSEVRVIPGTAPTLPPSGGGAAARSAFAQVKPGGGGPARPAADGPPGSRTNPDGPGADAAAAGRRSPPDGPRSETIGSEDGSTAPAAAAAAHPQGGASAAAHQPLRRGDGEDEEDTQRSRDDVRRSRDDLRDRDDSRDRDERRRDRDRDRYRAYDDRDRRDRRERDRDERERDDRYYDRDRRRRYDSIDSRRGDDYGREYDRDRDRDRHGRRRDERHAYRDDYDDRRRRDPRERRHRDERDYYEPSSRPSSRAGSERDYDGRPPSRSHSYYSHRDSAASSYHGGYGYRAERGAGGRQPDSVYGHHYGGAQRPVYDDRTLYNYFVHLERVRATNPALFTQQMAAYRQNNPAFYRDLCQRHYRSLLQPHGHAAAAAAHAQSGPHPHGGGAGSEERTSVHSGRSSVNGDDKRFVEQFHQRRPGSAMGYEPSAILHNQSFAASETSYRLRRFEEDTTAPEDTKPDRLTPAKFGYPHTVVRFSGTGQLVRVLPHSPADGSAALVEIHDTNALLAQTPEALELRRFPGPLVKHETHKSSVLQFCQTKMREAARHPTMVDKDSCVLVWELLLLLIRQNGMVVGSDMAELLLADRSSPARDDDAERDSGSLPATPDGSVGVDRSLVNAGRHPDRQPQPGAMACFTEMLMFGHRKEALELAMKRGVWGHALFLASKMDQRTYGMVVSRFASSLPSNDPLQTLYQLMAGRQPACTTSCADERWGDWRPHLAMILSNTAHRPELNRRAIVTLGDTLASRGLLHAAHFCYLMAQCEFGPFHRKASKLVLIGSPHQLPWKQFATNEALQRTEVFEYAQSLGSTDYVLTHLQAMKYLYATRLAEVGMMAECLHYCEVIAQTIVKYPASFSYALVSRVYGLAYQLKYFDAHYQSGEGELAEMGDPEWLVALQGVIAEMQAGRLPAYPQQDGGAQQPQEAVGTPSGGDLSQQTAQTDPGQQQVTYGQSTDQTTQEAVPQNQTAYSDYTGQPAVDPTQQAPYDVSQQQPYDPTQQQQSYDPAQQQQQQAYDAAQQQQQPFVPQPVADQADATAGDYWGGWNYASTPAPNTGEEGAETRAEADSVDAIAPPSVGEPENYSLWDGSQRKMSEVSAASEGELEPATSQAPPTSGAGSQSANSSADKPAQGGGGGSGWFGGIFSKFRPKNQMILPDDSNKSIVYDPDKKRWVDKDADPNDQQAAGAVAPPSDTQLRAGGGGAPGGAPPPPSLGPPSGNKFKIPKGRGMRSNYVDVFGGGPAAASGGGSGAPPPGGAGPAPPALSPIAPAPGGVSGSESSLDQPMAASGAPPMFNPGQVTGGGAAPPPSGSKGRLGRYGRRQ